MAEAGDITSSETGAAPRRVQVARSHAGDAAEAVVEYQGEPGDERASAAQRLAEGAAWLRLGRLRLERGDTDGAIVCARSGLDAVGPRYAGRMVEDDTELKLAAAEERIAEDHAADGAQVMLRVLDTRTRLLAELHTLTVVAPP